MKKVILPLMFLLSVLLAGCQCEHEWVEADCVTAKTCSVCEEVEGEPLGHSWQEATCEEAKQCERCQAAEGEPLGHSWQEANCTQPKHCERCGETEGEPLGHSYDRWTVVQGMMERSCWKCKDKQTQEIDRKVLAEDFLIGKWIGDHCTNGEKYVDLPEGEYISFTEDGKFEFCFLEDVYSGEWKYRRYDKNNSTGMPVYIITLSLKHEDDNLNVMFYDQEGMESICIIVEDILFSYVREA